MNRWDLRDRAELIGAEEDIRFCFSDESDSEVGIIVCLNILHFKKYGIFNFFSNAN